MDTNARESCKIADRGSKKQPLLNVAGNYNPSPSLEHSVPSFEKAHVSANSSTEAVVSNHQAYSNLSEKYYVVKSCFFVYKKLMAL